jgi:hypothetical protein
MIPTATSTAAPAHRLGSPGSSGGRPSARSHLAPTSGPPAHGAVTLFEVPFASAMGDGDLALLVRSLDLSTHMHPNTPSHNPLGLARLDHSSGLFLRRGGTEGEWLLEARTSGHPAVQSVHEWHVLAAGAAHQLDPAVTFPDRLAVSSPEIPDRQLGRAANKRLARIRRRLVGLP